jgi:hypothetical protein
MRLLSSSLERVAIQRTATARYSSERKRQNMTNFSSRNHSTQTSEVTSSSTTTSTNNLPNLLHKRASTRRTFAPNSNAQAMLVSGGEILARNASWDPQYSHARNYIRNHAVGPAVLSPILIQGLVGALVEATLPQSFFVENRLRQIRPLIVGVEVEATIEVVSVASSGRNANGAGKGDVASAPDATQILRAMYGYELEIETRVERISDGALIAEGQQIVWVPNYASDILSDAL